MELDIRELERESIREFVQRAADDGYLGGRVLDYGCGKMPYQAIVREAGGYYLGYDRLEFAGNVSGKDEGLAQPLEAKWDAILSTQSIQYWHDPIDVLNRMRLSLYRRGGGGWLILTGPTNWPVVETADLHRWTPDGIGYDLTETGFSEVAVTTRGRFSFGGDDRWCTGWGVIARA